MTHPVDDERDMETGTVIEEKGGMILVEAEPGSCCDGCAAGASCALVEGTKKRRIWMDNRLGARAGDTVAFTVPARAVVAGSALLYALPAVMLVAGILAGPALRGWTGLEREAAAMIGGAAGLIMSAVIIAALSAAAKRGGRLAPLPTSILTREGNNSRGALNHRG